MASSVVNGSHRLHLNTKRFSASGGCAVTVICWFCCINWLCCCCWWLWLWPWWWSTCICSCFSMPKFSEFILDKMWSMVESIFSAAAWFKADVLLLLLWLLLLLLCWCWLISCDLEWLCLVLPCGVCDDDDVAFDVVVVVGIAVWGVMAFTVTGVAVWVLFNNWPFKILIIS